MILEDKFLYIYLKIQFCDKIIKTEFVYRCFDSFEELERELLDYVNWYNNIRIHGSLDYQKPVHYRLQLSL